MEREIANLNKAISVIMSFLHMGYAHNENDFKDACNLAVSTMKEKLEINERLKNEFASVKDRQKGEKT